MGCCSSQIERVILDPEQYLLTQINESNLKGQSIELISNFEKEKVDKLLIKFDSIETNALGLGFILSNIKLIRYLHSSLNANFSVLEEELQCQNVQLMELAIDFFNADVMKYFIPIYLSLEQEDYNVDLDHTINFTSFCIPNIRKKIHPMRYAVEKENIEFIDFILKYFRNSKPPNCFDIHAIDEETGENCALIACKVGSLKMVSFLHKCKCDFKILNKRGENAINLSLLCNSHIKSHCNVAVIPYLIEVVGLDVSDNYEESLMICKNQVLIQYLEDKLQGRGLYVTKQYVESKYTNSFSFPTLIIDNPSKLSIISSFVSIPSPIELCEPNSSLA